MWHVASNWLNADSRQGLTPRYREPLLTQVEQCLRS